MARILVVDDAAFMRLRCSRTLKENGYEVEEAENGLEAVRRYAANRPDGVLMDITMPEMDGLTALKEIRKTDPKAKIAMVTAMGQQSMVIEALKFGAADFIVKPFDADRILASVAKLVA